MCEELIDHYLEPPETFPTFSRRVMDLWGEISGESKSENALHTLTTFAILEAEEVTLLSKLLEQQNHEDGIYKFLLYIRQAIVEITHAPEAKYYTTGPLPPVIIENIRTIISAQEFDGFTDILGQEIETFLQHIENGTPHLIPHPTPKRVPDKEVMVYNSSVQLYDHFASRQRRPIPQRLKLKYGHEPYPLQEDMARELRLSPVSRSMFVVTLEDDFTQIPRYIALESPQHFHIVSYPDCYGYFESNIRGYKSRLYRRLKTLHHEAVFQALERECGIDIYTIPFKAQMFFLEYIHQASKSQIETLKRVFLSLNKKDQKYVTTAFWACSEEPELVDQLLSTLEDPKQREIFLSLYTGIIMNLQIVETECPESHVEILYSFQQKYIHLVGREFLKAFVAPQSFEEKREICQTFFQNTNNIIQIFQTLAQILQEFHEDDGCKDENEYYKSAEAQLKKMIDRWSYPTLPEDFAAQVSKPLNSEPMPEGATLPVGISRKHEHFEEVEEGRLRALKSANMLPYIWEINAQAQNGRLAICRKIQRHNLPDSADAIMKMRLHKMGHEDILTYKRVIRYYDLQNISVTPCETLVDPEKFIHYHKIVTSLYNNVNFNPAFSKAAQLSAYKSSNNYNPAYVIEEVAWILASSHPKISHLTEAQIGYDPIACVIQNMERIAGPKVWNFQTSELFPTLLCRVLYGLRTVLDEKITTCSGAKKKYYQAFKDFCFGSKERQQNTNPETPIPKAAFSTEEIKASLKKKVSMIEGIEVPFIVPSEFITLSFGNSSKNPSGNLTRREPYMTMFVDPQNPGPHLESLPLENVSGIESALLSRADTKKQQQHLEEVLIPLLRAYINHRESFGEKYYLQFDQDVSRAKKKISHEIGYIHTYPDLIRFIRKYVLLPDAMKTQT